MDVSNLTIYEDDFKIHQTKLYLCDELNTKLIYESMQTLKVNGIASSINGKIIEVIARKIKDKKDYFKIRAGDSEVGWIALDQSPRVYRIPKVTGKILNDRVSIYKDNNYSVSDLKYKLMEARYYFQLEDEQFFIINRVGHRENILPIIKEDFNRYITPKDKTFVEVSEGDDMYKSSTSDEVLENITDTESVEVIGFYEGTNQIKVKYKNKSGWIYKELDLTQEKNNNSIKNLEFIDQIMYLKIKSHLQKLKIDTQEKRIENIKENVAVSNDLQQLYLNKYLGDQNDIK
ncbi:GW dipeptide domain-containing protein [Jeotgalicoccus meleagridis]|uniref:GW domain-containing protein n=1 Tax=Jeotgalicoccus meleagridis TaxID=2759181 RepID=A0A6V7RKY1_9STAP|nr:GW dipeptide domain-containing protein [Jeotgalicoccus meleagridis]CAD2078907.1 hypothetical protein JEODO184_01524 [Jeotgalicoccus meleagridis]